MDEELGRTAQSTPASVRRELWRDTQQQSVGSIEEYSHLDTSDRDTRYGCQISGQTSGDAEESQLETDEYHTSNTSPYATRSPQSSFSSPQVSVDSPRISFSPLHIKDSIEVRNMFSYAGLYYLIIETLSKFLFSIYT